MTGETSGNSSFAPQEANVSDTLITVYGTTNGEPSSVTFDIQEELAHGAQLRGEVVPDEELHKQALAMKDDILRVRAANEAEQKRREELRAARAAALGYLRGIMWI